MAKNTSGLLSDALICQHHETGADSHIRSSNIQQMSIPAHNSYKPVQPSEDEKGCSSAGIPHQNLTGKVLPSGDILHQELQQKSTLPSLWSSNLLYRVTVHILYIGVLLYLICNSLILDNQVAHLEEKVNALTTATDDLYMKAVQPNFADEIRKVCLQTRLLLPRTLCSSLEFVCCCHPIKGTCLVFTIFEERNFSSHVIIADVLCDVDELHSCS